MNNDQPLVFVKSSYSNGQGDCVEVARKHNGGRAVRDSKNAGVGMFSASPSAWAAFIQNTKLDN